MSGSPIVIVAGGGGIRVNGAFMVSKSFGSFVSDVGFVVDNRDGDEEVGTLYTPTGGGMQVLGSVPIGASDTLGPGSLTVSLP